LTVPPHALPDLAALATFDERLREVASEPAEVEAALAVARIALDRAEKRDRGWLLGYIGNAERMLGRPFDASHHFRESLELATSSGDARGRAVALIRLAEAQRCAEESAEGERSARAALAVIDADPGLTELRDFALQHLGKCLVELGRRDEAIAVLQEALALREAKEAADLVASSRLALEWARS
jgi:HTH-type transcriptional regulator, pleiotropic regulator of extracellular virulence genes